MEDVGKEVVNGAASLGNAALHHPGQAAAAVGGAALTAVSGLGEGAGAALDITGVGAIAGVPLNVVSTAGVAAGVGITGTAMGAMAMEAAGEDHVQVFNTDSGGGNAEPTPGEDPPFQPPEKVTGKVSHARERMHENSRNDGGVTDSAADDAFNNPVKPPKYIPDKYGGTYRYTGKDAVVNVNKDGEITTGWPRTSAGRRFPK